MYRFLNMLPLKPHKIKLDISDITKSFGKVDGTVQNYSMFGNLVSEYGTRVQIDGKSYNVTVIFCIENGTVEWVEFPELNLIYEFVYQHSSADLLNGQICETTNLINIVVSKETFDGRTRRKEFLKFFLNSDKKPDIIYRSTHHYDGVNYVEEAMLCPHCLSPKMITKRHGDHTVTIFYSDDCQSHTVDVLYVLKGIEFDCFQGLPSVFVRKGIEEKVFKSGHLEDEGIKILDGKIWFFKEGKCFNHIIKQNFEFENLSLNVFFSKDFEEMAGSIRLITSFL